ncbi:hypothetical protein AQUCO_01600016v1 [Aquilegia coerulea]|uniref:Zinc knuckle CX2CX4HX4C domain-containing protein n=1 Tax=Aquilegia coerulea TaxID=218851 RepID=A0A2G5DPV2_AQUCA|nr:hypothetical protein AQUCO_01600016v1 [Aquilegia coerulea]
MCFIGLELEHHSTEIVGMIASAAGTVSEVLPVGVIPRAAEGYRAHVNVLINFPLVEGTLVNTLAKGDVWIGFKYNGLPSLYCVICRRLGHDRQNCNFPPIQPSEQELLRIGFHDEVQPLAGDEKMGFVLDPSVAMEGSTIWPHEIAATQDILAEMGQASKSRNDLDLGLPNDLMGGPERQSKKLIHLWTQTGLFSQDELQALGIQAQTTGEPITNGSPGL